MSTFNRPKLGVPAKPQQRPKFFEQTLLGKRVRVQTKSPAVLFGTLSDLHGAFLVLTNAEEHRWSSADSALLVPTGAFARIAVDRQSVAMLYEQGGEA